MKINNFFQSVAANQMSDLEIENFIQNQTHNFQFNKLKMFYKILEKFIAENSDHYSEVENKNIMTLNDDISKYIKRAKFERDLNRIDALHHYLGNDEDADIPKPERSNSEIIIRQKDDLIKFPAALEVASIYYSETNSKNRLYNVDDIEAVMTKTREYLKSNSNITTILGHISKILETCGSLKGGYDAKSNWIKFYSYKAGKYPEHKLARTEEKN